MELNKDIVFLRKPNIYIKDLKYVLSTKEVYVNLFEIRFNKGLSLYQYPYAISPPIGAANTLIRDKLFRRSYKQLKKNF
mgnify:CR=1 FL=1